MSCWCLMQVSYAIGVAQPLSVHVDSYGTGRKPDKEILAAVLRAFDFRPGELPWELALCCPSASNQLQRSVALQCSTKSS